MTDAVIIVTTKKQSHQCCCYCYSKQSTDSRCCGLCYCACPSKKVENQCNVCNNNVYDFCSLYMQTKSGTGGGNKDNECEELGWDDCFCSVFCLPIKLPLFLPCFIGSMVNECINKMASTKRNYLF
jgi:hypothetical protein